MARTKEQRRLEYLSNRERYLENSKKNNAKNKERARKTKRKYYETNLLEIKERQRSFYEKNREAILKRAKERRLANPDFYREVHRKRNIDNSPSNPRKDKWLEEEYRVVIENHKTMSTTQLAFLLNRTYAAVQLKKAKLRKAGLL